VHAEQLVLRAGPPARVGVRVHEERAERNVAAALGPAQRVALGVDRRVARRVVERRERGEHACVIAAALDRERALRGRRHEALRLQPDHGHAVERAVERWALAQPFDAGGGEQYRVEVALAQAPDPRRHVAAQRHDREVGTEMREPHAPARGRRADASADFERQPLGRAARQRAGAHEQQVRRVDALRHRADHEYLGRGRRQILERVHGELDPPLDERLLDLAHEHALRADRGELRALVAVARGLDDRELHVVARGAQRLSDRRGLGAREVGAARAEPERRARAHASLG
jgi:hypothetical protein